MTRYRVLTNDALATWALIAGEYEAANDEAAIKAALASGATELGDDGQAEFVAVPVRSWRPRKVQAKAAFEFS